MKHDLVSIVHCACCKYAEHFPTDPRVLICANPKWVPMGDDRDVKEPYVKPDDFCSFGEAIAKEKAYARQLQPSECGGNVFGPCSNCGAWYDVAQGTNDGEFLFCPGCGAKFVIFRGCGCGQGVG